MNHTAGLSSGFIDRVAKRESVIAIIGLGYVGLPLMLGFHKQGFNVLGLDIDSSKIDALMSGKSYISYLPAENIGSALKSGRFQASDDFSRLKSADAILICVPTPLTDNREPDVSYIVSTANSIAPHLQKGQLVVLESTTYPGTTRELLQPILESGSGMTAGSDFFVAYSPEREDPGNAEHNATNIPKVVGGATGQALDMAVALYGALVPQIVSVSSLDAAEAVKITENIFRAVNIALVNELKVIYSEMGIDVWEVIDAAKTKPFGFMPFYPGPGLGGHCIPIDPFYLTWKAREFQLNTRFIELAGEINHNMPRHVIASLGDALSRKLKKALNGANILIVGMAYKKNIDDTRESPSLVLMELLQSSGALVDYHDPYIASIPSTRDHPELTGLKSVQWVPEVIRSYDAVLISTDHDVIDWQMLVDNADLIVDTRNVLKDWNQSHGDKIFKA